LPGPPPQLLPQLLSWYLPQLQGLHWLPLSQCLLHRHWVGQGWCWLLPLKLLTPLLLAGHPQLLVQLLDQA
jgi:hypothetical protein